MSLNAADLAPVTESTLVTRLGPAELRRIVTEIEAAELALRSTPSAFYHPLTVSVTATSTPTQHEQN